MTSKADFTEEEWTRLKRAPFVAGLAISLADPGGPIEAVKETSATLKTVRSAECGGRGEFVGSLAREVVEEATHRKNPLGGFKPSKGANAGVGDPRGAPRGQRHRLREGGTGRRRGDSANGCSRPRRRRRTPRRRVASWAGTPSG